MAICSLQKKFKWLNKTESELIALKSKKQNGAVTMDFCMFRKRKTIEKWKCSHWLHSKNFDSFKQLWPNIGERTMNGCRKCTYYTHNYRFKTKCVEDCHVQCIWCLQALLTGCHGKSDCKCLWIHMFRSKKWKYQNCDEFKDIPSLRGDKSWCTTTS